MSSRMLTVNAERYNLYPDEKGTERPTRLWSSVVFPVSYNRYPDEKSLKNSISEDWNRFEESFTPVTQT